MASVDSGAFELLLSPESLSERAPHLSDLDAAGHLRSFLNLLQAEKAKSASASPVAPLAPPEDPDVAVLPQPEVAAVSDRLVTRKQAVLQLLSLQLTGKLEWSLTTLGAQLSISQQQQVIKKDQFKNYFNLGR